MIRVYKYTGNKYTGNIKQLRLPAITSVSTNTEIWSCPAAIEAEAELSLGVKLHGYSDRSAAHGTSVAPVNITGYSGTYTTAGQAQAWGFLHNGEGSGGDNCSVNKAPFLSVELLLPPLPLPLLKDPLLGLTCQSRYPTQDNGRLSKCRQPQQSVMWLYLSHTVVCSGINVQ